MESDGFAAELMLRPDALLRVTGKPTLSKMDAFDFIVTLHLGVTPVQARMLERSAARPVHDPTIRVSIGVEYNRLFQVLCG
jgi:hypothetical protein